MAEETLNFGTRVHDFTAGTLHDHIFNFKVDLDIGGVSNSLIQNTVSTVSVTPQDINGVPYANSISSFAVASDYMTKKLTRSKVKAEAGITLDQGGFVDYSIVQNATNLWGGVKGYKFKVNGMIRNLVTGTKSMAAIKYTKYTFAVTRSKDSEQYSGSCFDLLDPTGTVFNAAKPTPLVDFDSFIDGESIDGEDLVLWVNFGSRHVPDAEDIPVTNTIGNLGNVLFLPVNMYNYDNLVDLGNTVYIEAPNSAAPTSKPSKAKSKAKGMTTPTSKPIVSVSPWVNLYDLVIPDTQQCPVGFDVPGQGFTPMA